jgi:starch synthase
MQAGDRNLRILVVTPEVTCVPYAMGAGSRTISARTDGLGDICAALIQALYERGVDVHLAIPNYRNLFNTNARRMRDIGTPARRRVPPNRIHLAQDRSFFYHRRLFQAPDWENIRIALAFQREVINRIIPEVRPDLIHCFDWMTGLIPAASRQIGIPSVFTFYRLDSPHLLLATMEERGIDAAAFWQQLYYARMPLNYQETRDTNPADLLISGIFSAHMVQALSETFLRELMDDTSGPAGPALKTELSNKRRANCLAAVAPAPDSSFNPAKDRSLMRTYSPETHCSGKRYNKLRIQEHLGLRPNADAPLCLWPTRLDGARPGCRLLAETLATMLATYRAQDLQVAFVADGDFQEHLRAMVRRMDAAGRVAVSDFDARRCRLAYGAADFVLMPMRHDPCALPCKIGQRYGALPIAYHAGAICDCVTHLDVDADRGTGFLFEHFDANGFLWALEQAMAFHARPPEVRSVQVRRIMRESLVRFDHEQTTVDLIDLYAQALERPLAHLKARTVDSGDARIAA